LISILNLYKKHKKVFITSNAAFVGGAMVTKKRMGGASELWTWKLLTNSTSCYENLRETRSKKSKRHASCFIRLTSPASCLSVCHLIVIFTVLTRNTLAACVDSDSVQCLYVYQTRATTRSTSCCRSATRSVPSTSTQSMRLVMWRRRVSAVTRLVCFVAAELTTSVSTAPFIDVSQSIISASTSTHIVVSRLSSLLLFSLCPSLSSLLRLSPSGCGCSDDDLPPTGLHHCDIVYLVSVSSSFTV